MDFSESDNFNAKEIAEESEHLERVIKMIREQIRLLESDGFEYRSVNFYDDSEVLDYRDEKFRHDARRRDVRLLKASLSAPYFARMKLIPIAGKTERDTPSMTRARSLFSAAPLEGETDIYIGAHLIVYKDRVIVYSHNSPLGNKIYERFENGTVECNGYTYEVVFRRKFDIRGGKLMAVFQDYSKESGGVVYDKFLAHMLRVRRGDKRLTDIIPTIQANQNAIITRPADENCVVTGCAGCGKTMIILQRLEYLSFNKRIELDNAIIVSPSKRYIEHIQPVVDDLMINAARRVTVPELYREILLSMKGVSSSLRRAVAGETEGDESLSDETVVRLYGDGVKRAFITALSPIKKSYLAAYSRYRDARTAYEREVDWARANNMSSTAVKPKRPAVNIDLKKFECLNGLGSSGALTKCKLYLLLTAYCYILGKPDFSKALFIDEAQDLFFNEYKLLAECTKAVVNVYGDENQQIADGRGIGSFDKLDELWNTKRYALNENYRNAREITEFVNGLLSMNVTSLGLEGGKVEYIDMSALKAELARAADDRIAVIYSERDTAIKTALESFVPADKLYTVKECKGMEYERVYVCGASLTDREKYVAYTRALSELYIIN